MKIGLASLCLILICMNAWPQHSDSIISDRSLESMVYHSILQKPYHRIRMTVKMRGSQQLFDIIGNSDGLSDVLQDVMSDVDGMADVQELVAYNIRISYRTKDKRFRIYAGENRMMLNGNAYYMGVRIKI